MEITKEMLNQMKACHDGMRWFLKHFPEGKTDLKSLIIKLNEDKQESNLNWLHNNLLTFDGIDIKSYVNESVNAIMEMVAFNKEKEAGYNVKISSSDADFKIVDKNYGTTISISGMDSEIVSISDEVQIGESGNYNKIFSIADYAKIGSSGYDVKISSIGNDSLISGFGAKIGSSGDYARISSSGHSVKINSTGENAVISILNGGIFRVGEGGAVSVAYFDGKRTRFAVGYVGENLKPDTWYVVNNDGEFVEQ